MKQEGPIPEMMDAELLEWFAEHLPLDVRLGGLSKEDFLAGLTIEQRLAGLTIEELLAGLTPAQLDEILALAIAKRASF